MTFWSLASYIHTSCCIHYVLVSRMHMTVWMIPEISRYVYISDVEIQGTYQDEEELVFYEGESISYDNGLITNNI